MEDVGVSDTPRPVATVIVDGTRLAVPDLGATLLDVLRSHAITSVKDGCAPQGQCGCCTVLVDGQPRVACVTPVRRVIDKAITTAAGLDDADHWAQAFWDAGASQCGFCTPGIIVRLAGLHAKKPNATRTDLDRALAAHLCRCTGWNTIIEAWETRVAIPSRAATKPRDSEAVSARASLEGSSPQTLSPSLCVGAPIFSADTAPAGALVALRGTDGEWVTGPDLVAVRRQVDKVQGRRSTLEPIHPVPVPEGDWVATLQTTWVDPAYLETDASWCSPGQDPVSALANGGAFGAKATSPIGAIARRLADQHGQTVVALMSREDTIRLGAKRPPIGGGVRADGSGVLTVGGDESVAEAVAERLGAFAPTANFEVRSFPVPGPPTSALLRGAGVAEAFALVDAANPDRDRYRPITVTLPGSGEVTVRFASDTSIHVHVDGGDPLDTTILRSYVIGAVHMAISLVGSEALAVADDGEVQDLTVRSLGVLRSAQTPSIEVTVAESDRPSAPVSEAVFVAAVAGAWRHAGIPTTWPVTSSQNR